MYKHCTEYLLCFINSIDILHENKNFLYGELSSITFIMFKQTFVWQFLRTITRINC